MHCPLRHYSVPQSLTGQAVANALQAMVDGDRPITSFRMKAYRSGQQTTELLNRLSAKPGFSRWHVRDLLTKEFPVKIVTISKGPDDPGYSTFQDLDVARLDLLRSRVVASLLAK